MAVDSAQVSTLNTSLGELVDRVTRLAEGYQGSPREDVAADLYDVERHLRAAQRRVEQLLDRI
jgi:Mg2+ and Co2+ transporter CorA